MLIDTLNIHTSYYCINKSDGLTISLIVNEDRIIFGYSLCEFKSNKWQLEKEKSIEMLNNQPHIIFPEGNSFLKDGCLILKIIQYIIQYLNGNKSNIQYKKYFNSLCEYEKNYISKLLKNIEKSLSIK